MSSSESDSERSNSSSSSNSSSENSNSNSNSNAQGSTTPTATLQEEQKRKDSDDNNPNEGSQAKKSNKHNHTLSWENIVHKVKIPAKRNWKFQVIDEEYEKVILSGVSGFAKAGEVLAIMGPSGGGKTSLLDILAQRTELKDSEESENTNVILVNGKPVEFFSCAYVKQEDLLMASATVRETLQYSAQLRLPPEIPYEAKMERVEKLINTLELNQVAETRIGNELYRGVSGGEKKRVAIGVEMITNPKLLFLDEPTTGLDASMSLSVLKSLKRLAKENHCTIICTIHQPRYEIFEMFDKLMLLVGGKVAYFGEVPKAIDFFAEAGFVCQDSENPADFFLDVLQNKDPNNPEGEANNNKFAETIVDAYNASKLKEENLKKLTKIRETAPQISKEEKKEAKKNRLQCVATPWTQLTVLLTRNFRNSLRDPIVFYGQMAQYLLMGLLAGFLYYQIDHDQEGLFKIQMFLFWDAIYMSMIASFTYVLTFSAIRNLYNRERQSNSYRTGYFLIALSLYQVPMQFASVSAFSLLTYFVAGMKTEPANFFIYLCLNFLMAQASEALAITCSIVTPGFDEANALVTLFITFWFSFTSVFINNDNVKPGLYWISYTSYYKWHLEGLLVNELKGEPFQCDSSPCPIMNEYVTINNQSVPVSEVPYNCTIDCVGYETGDDFLDSLHLTFDDTWPYIVIMAGIAVFFRLVSYLSLKYASAGKS